MLRQWADTWRQAGAELAAIEREERRRMTDAEAARVTVALLGTPLPAGLPERTTSGLVEQQRWFATLRDR